MPVAPATLAVIAEKTLGRPVSVDAYSVARMIRSEGSAAGRIRAHVALNDLAELGWSSPTSLITYSTASWAKGFYGAQFSAKYRTAAHGETWERSEAALDGRGKPIVIASQTRRYASTRDPYEGDLELAERVLAERAAGVNPVPGAVKFVDRSSFGAQEGTGSYAALVQRWAADGLQPFNVPGYSDDLVVFRRVG